MTIINIQMHSPTATEKWYLERQVVLINSKFTQHFARIPPVLALFKSPTCSCKPNTFGFAAFNQSSISHDRGSLADQKPPPHLISYLHHGRPPDTVANLKFPVDSASSNYSAGARHQSWTM
jgi:hypothetical protein